METDVSYRWLVPDAGSRRVLVENANRIVEMRLWWASNSSTLPIVSAYAIHWGRVVTKPFQPPPVMGIYPQNGVQYAEVEFTLGVPVHVGLRELYVEVPSTHLAIIMVTLVKLTSNRKL